MAKAKDKKKPADEKKPQLSINPPEAKKSEADKFIKDAKTASKKEAETPTIKPKVETVKQTFTMTAETNKRLIMAVATEKINNPKKKTNKSLIIEAAIVQWLNKKKVVVD